MNSRRKRVSIRTRMQVMVLIIIIVSLMVVSAVGVISMFRIRTQAQQVFLKRMENNLISTVTNKAEIANTEFDRYIGFADTFSEYIHELYKNPDKYADREVPPPSPDDIDIFTIKRYIAREDISYEAVKAENCLLGNVEPIIAPITERHDEILAVYLSTASGLQISYDSDSELTAHKDGSEVFYDYFDRPWYTLAAEKQEICFTNIYADSYDRGYMVTCVAPFYNAKDEFAGVVCIDMLIEHVYSVLVDFDILEGNQDYAFLVDGNGYAVDPKYNHMNLDNHPDIGSGEIARKILSGETGVSKSETGTYFAYAPIEAVNWKLCLHVPESAVIEPVNEMNVKIGSSIVAFLVLFGIIAMIIVFMVKRFTRSITEPLLALRNDAKEISNGNLEHEAKAYFNDEIGDLALSFNSMASSLKDYIANLTAVTAEKERIGAELEVATQIQEDMLPRQFPAFPYKKEFDLYATMVPAKEVGGDFYDFFLLDDDHLCMVIADVSGKGVPAALFMVNAKTLIKYRATLGGSPSEILAYTNEQLCQGNDAELFVTVWVAILEISTGKVVEANAGHEHPVIKRCGGDFLLDKYRHSPAVATFPEIQYIEREYELKPGDSIFVYTDGVPEATNKENELFGTDRMLVALNANKDKEIEEVLKGVTEAISEFVGDAPQFDDTTMLVLNYYGPGADK